MHRIVRFKDRVRGIEADLARMRVRLGICAEIRTMQDQADHVHLDAERERLIDARVWSRLGQQFRRILVRVEAHA